MGIMPTRTRANSKPAKRTPDPDAKYRTKRYAIPAYDFGELAIAMIDARSARANLLHARLQLSVAPETQIAQAAEMVMSLARRQLEANTVFNTLFASVCSRLSIDAATHSVQLKSDRQGFALLVKANPAAGTADVPPQ